MAQPPDNPELTTAAFAIAEALASIDDELFLLRSRFAPRQHAVLGAQRAAGSWPWAPGTAAQGFLGHRWNRRDGNVYAGAQFRGNPGPNSPIAGGQDAQAKVSVASGIPKQRQLPRA